MVAGDVLQQMVGQGHEAVEGVTIARKMEGLRPWEA